MFSETLRRVDQPEVLMHHPDPSGDGVARVVELDGPTVDLDHTRIGTVEAGQNVHQRRLAGAVLAEKGMDLADARFEVDLVVRDDSREDLRDPAHRDGRRLPCGVSVGTGEARSSRESPGIEFVVPRRDHPSAEATCTSSAVDLVRELPSQPPLLVVGKPRAVDTVEAELANLVRSPTSCFSDLHVLGADVGVEHRRVVRVDHHGQIARDHVENRMLGVVLRIEVADRGRGRAHGERDPLVAAPLDESVVLENVIPVVDPLAAEDVEAGRDVPGRSVLAGVSGQAKPTARREPIGVDELLRGIGASAPSIPSPISSSRRCSSTCSTISSASAGVSCR